MNILIAVMIIAFILHVISNIAGNGVKQRSAKAQEETAKLDSEFRAYRYFNHP